MLTAKEPSGGPAVASVAAGHDVAVDTAGKAPAQEAACGRLAKMLRVEWIGQTAASLCWIISVFSYGIDELGDWLQLAAASAWLVANIATIVANEAD